ECRPFFWHVSRHQSRAPRPGRSFALRIVWWRLPVVMTISNFDRAQGLMSELRPSPERSPGAVLASRQQPYFPFGRALLTIQSTVRCRQQLIDRLAILREYRCPRTHRNRRFLAVVPQPLGNSLRHVPSRFGFCFRENQHEFVPSVSSTGI